MRWRLSVSLQGQRRQESLRLSKGVAGKEKGMRKKRFLICNVSICNESSHLSLLYLFNPLLPYPTISIHPLFLTSLFLPSLSLSLFFQHIRRRYASVTKQSWQFIPDWEQGSGCLHSSHQQNTQSDVFGNMESVSLLKWHQVKAHSRGSAHDGHVLAILYS